MRQRERHHRTDACSTRSGFTATLCGGQGGREGGGAACIAAYPLGYASTCDVM